MSDAGILMSIYRRDGRELGKDDRDRARSMLDRVRERSPALTGELGAPAEWREVPMGSSRATFIVFEYWGDDIDLNVLGPDGIIRPPTFVLAMIDGEEVEVPEAPPERNPGPDEMLTLILERDLACAQQALADAGIEAELGDELHVELVAEHW